MSGLTFFYNFASFHLRESLHRVEFLHLRDRLWVVLLPSSLVHHPLINRCGHALGARAKRIITCLERAEETFKLSSETKEEKSELIDAFADS